jgi:hypothetical protein
MTQTPESRTEPTTVTEQPRYDDRLLAWIGIIAGVVFVVAVIFFSGFFLGSSSDSHYGWHRGYYGDRDSSCPMMGHGGMMGPGGPMAPQQSPTTKAPTTPRP